MSRVVRVAAAQLGPAAEVAADNVPRLVALIQAAGGQGVQLIAFPELALTTYFPTRVHDADLDTYFEDGLDAPNVAAVRAAARAAGLALVLPLAERAPHGRFNSAALFDADGTLLGLYRKMHIPGTAEPRGRDPESLERRYFLDGDLGFPVHDSSLGRIGMLICADRALPESWRCLGLADAEIVVTPYNTSTNVAHNPRSGRSAVETLRYQQPLRMCAGANQNGYFVVAPGKAGVERGVPYIGDSMVIGCWGDILARAATEADELVIHDLDLDDTLEAKAHLNLAQRRRPDTYGVLTAPAAAPVAV
jgi:N-carbamoyl-D-amino-acid hydrolase